MGLVAHGWVVDTQLKWDLWPVAGLLIPDLYQVTNSSIFSYTIFQLYSLKYKLCVD